MGRRIAIVEEEAAIRENYSDAFARQGYAVSAYADRPSALAAFRERLPELAIIDIGLGNEPEGGFTLCAELRALSQRIRRDADDTAIAPVVVVPRASPWPMVLGLAALAMATAALVLSL